VAVFDPDEFQAEQGLTDGGSAQSSGRSTMVLERLYPWREGSGRVPRGHRERCRSQDRCASPRAAAGTARLAQPRAA
jgi:hypothetical protein